MATYSTNLALTLMATGEQSNTWGDTTNTNLGTLLEQAISGYVTQAITDGSSANTTITIPNGATGVARNMFIEMTGALTFSTTSLIVPANKKMYFIFNNTSGGFAVTVKVSGQTGILVPNGKKVVLTCNGTDIVEAHTAIVGNATMGGTLGITGTTTAAAINASGLVAMAGAATVGTTLGVTGATTLSSTLGVTGVATLGNGAILGTPASGTVTNLTGTASININGTVGATTPAAGAFTSLTASTTLGVTGVSTLTAGAVIQGLTVGLGAGAVSTNTAVGASALAANTTGFNNTAIGQIALTTNTSGAFNTAIGRAALNASTGDYNTGVGASALVTNSSGAYNTALGAQALNANTTASNNTAVGYQAGYTNVTGTNNTYTGWSAGRLATGNSNTAFGAYSAYAQTTASNNAFFGTSSGSDNTTGASNTAFGTSALQSNTTASNNTAVGYQSLYTNTGGNSTAVGYQALKANTTGGSDAFGFQALTANTTGVSNNAFGFYSLLSNTTGSYNTAFGQQSLLNNTTASYNTAVGYQAGYSQTTADYNTFVGYYAGRSTTGDQNTFLGKFAGNAVTTGTLNTIIGAYNGNQGGLDIRTASNYIVLSDGGGTPRGIFDDSGNFRVGTTGSGTRRMQVETNLANYAIGMFSTNGTPYGYYAEYSTSPNATGSDFFQGVDSTTSRVVLRSNGGIANYQANNVNLSDRREKTNFAPAKSYLDIICAIPVQTFNYIDQNHEKDPGLTLGVVAQDVQAVAPELVMESNWAKQGDESKMRLSIYQTDLQYALMKCIQEQQAIITALTTRITALEAK